MMDDGDDGGCAKLSCAIIKGEAGSQGDPEDKALESISKIKNPFTRVAAYATASYYFAAWKADAWLYKNVPSGWYWQFSTYSLSGTFPDGVLGVGVSASKHTYAFNWRSFQLSSFNVYEVDIPIIGSPGISVSDTLVGGKIWGASSNDSYKGFYASASVQGYAPIGAPLGTGIGLKDDFYKAESITDAIAVDPKSHLPVQTGFGGVGIGNPSISLIGSVGYSQKTGDIFDINLPFSLVPPNNPYLP